MIVNVVVNVIVKLTVAHLNKESVAATRCHHATQANYTARMEYIYAMQNMSFGDDGALASPPSPHLTVATLALNERHVRHFMNGRQFDFVGSSARTSCLFFYAPHTHVGPQCVGGLTKSRK